MTDQVPRFSLLYFVKQLLTESATSTHANTRGGARAGKTRNAKWKKDGLGPALTLGLLSAAPARRQWWNGKISNGLYSLQKLQRKTATRSRFRSLKETPDRSAICIEKRAKPPSASARSESFESINLVRAMRKGHSERRTRDFKAANMAV